MNAYFGARTGTYDESIARLKTEIKSYAAALRTSVVWPNFERDFRALGAIEDLAGVQKTTLEEMLGLPPANPAPTPANNPAKHSDLAIGDPQESEVAAEIEKGS